MTWQKNGPKRKYLLQMEAFGLSTSLEIVGGATIFGTCERDALAVRQAGFEGRTGPNGFVS